MLVLTRQRRIDQQRDVFIITEEERINEDNGIFYEKFNVQEANQTQNIPSLENQRRRHESF